MTKVDPQKPPKGRDGGVLGLGSRRPSKLSKNLRRGNLTILPSRSGSRVALMPPEPFPDRGLALSASLVCVSLANMNGVVKWSRSHKPVSSYSMRTTVDLHLKRSIWKWQRGDPPRCWSDSPRRADGLPGCGDKPPPLRERSPRGANRPPFGASLPPFGASLPPFGASLPPRRASFSRAGADGSVNRAGCPPSGARSSTLWTSPSPFGAERPPFGADRSSFGADCPPLRVDHPPRLVLAVKRSMRTRGLDGSQSRVYHAHCQILWKPVCGAARGARHGLCRRLSAL